MSKVITHKDENFGNSEEELQKFVQEEKSENAVKKTSSDMKCFYRFLGEINKTNVQILDLPPEELDHLLGKFFKDKENQWRGIRAKYFDGTAEKYPEVSV